MGAPKKGKEQTTKIESEIDELSEPFYAVFGFESVKEEGFPAIDIFENSDHIFIEAELPGVDREMVGISVAEGKLVIEGEKTGDRDESGKVNYICIERSFGKFQRTVDIPEAADTSKIRARYKEGILLVTIPKVKEQRKNKRKIEIE
ncbi:MAG: Hsp20/alpha crystallin family protein [Deltaproteobacteria bacterium]